MTTTTVGPGSPVDIPLVRSAVAGEIGVITARPDFSLAFGVKVVIVAVCTLVRLYDKHRENVSLDFPATVLGALDILVAACPGLQTLNPPGPR